MTGNDPTFVRRLLDVIEDEIVPKTRRGVALGNKIFGAAVLKKSDLSVVVAETNNEVESPLWHGEVHALKRFYELSPADRPRTRDCVFVATHEPCSLCLSAITWAGFDNFYYLFSYTDTRDAFAIPHDLRILDEVFNCPDGGYARVNAFWTSTDIGTLIDGLEREPRQALRKRIEALRAIYGELSAVYQRAKGGADIPLS